MQIANVNAFARPIIAQRQQDARNMLAMRSSSTAQGRNMLAPQSQQSSGNALSPNGGIESQIKSGLVRRGMPAHVADAFVMNMRDESGLNPGINEANPIVEGSRGGFGLYQLTGPRRREFEAYAQSNGVSTDDVDAQLDFLMRELGGSEKRAADAIYNTNTTGEAAAAIVNKFLRPSEEHRARREARYLRNNSTPKPATANEAGGMSFDQLFTFLNI